jgi:hypothetical protein
MCAIHNPLAWAAIPAISTRRIDRSIRNSTTYPRQPLPRPYLNREKVRCNQHIPMSEQKIPSM